jgi:hypothetical protein
MHAAAAGRQAAIDARRGALGPRDKATDYYAYEWLAAAGRQAAGALDVTPAPGAEADLAALVAAVREPGPWLTYTHGDPCPDNARRAAGRWRLLDFEFGDYRHALTDGVYGRMGFPSCWCAGSVPPPVERRMEAAYRAELARGCPIAGDAAAFAEAVVAGCAYWALTLCAWSSLPELMARDSPWGLVGRRQRLVLRFDAFARSAEATGHYAALGATFRAMTVKLRARWPSEAGGVTAYPAFRHSAPS